MAYFALEKDPVVHDFELVDTFIARADWNSDGKIASDEVAFAIAIWMDNWTRTRAAVLNHDRVTTSLRWQ